MAHQDALSSSISRRKQRTIARRAFVNGFGFWTGQDLVLEFAPAPENYGIRFVRTDLPIENSLPALLPYRINMPRQTSIQCGEVRFDMIEHVMAALRGLEIDNCRINIGGPEMPGIDGSSAPFFHVLRRAGIWTQSADKPVRIVKEAIRLNGNDWEIEVTPSQHGETMYRYDLDYTSFSQGMSVIPKQSFEMDLTPESFADEAAAARTFLAESEAKQLLDLGLCKRVTHKDVLVFNERGPIENQLRYTNECARHKVLDMIGDFSLTEAQIIGRFYARKTGHQQNAELLAEILDNTDVIA